jgi:hypothetical protein
MGIFLSGGHPFNRILLGRIEESALSPLMSRKPAPEFSFREREPRLLGNNVDWLGVSERSGLHEL